MNSSPEEAFRRYDELGARHTEVLRRLTKQIQVRLAFRRAPRPSWASGKSARPMAGSCVPHTHCALETAAVAASKPSTTGSVAKAFASLPLGWEVKERLPLLGSTHATARDCLQDARHARDNEVIKRTINEYDAALEAYIPGLMAMASIYWDMEHYSQVSMHVCVRAHQYVGPCSERAVLKLALATSLLFLVLCFK